MEEKQLNVQLKTSEKTSLASLKTLESSATEAQKKAVRFFVMGCFAALVSLFIPIAHFFLVPGFLIAAIVAYQYFKKSRVELTSCSIECPACQKQIQLNRQPLELPLKVVCDSCRALVEIQAAEPTSTAQGAL